MKRFLSPDEDRTVVEAIRDAESRTSGQIRVFISHAAHEDSLQAAREAMQKLRMTETKHRNAVLIFVAPQSRKFAIVGDDGAYEKLGDDVWRRIAADLHHGFTAGHRARAIARAVEATGSELGKHFPHEPGGGNSLPDNVVEG